MNATELLDYFWEQVSAKVVPSLGGGRTVGVWMADRPNGAGGSEHVWPPPHMSSLPKGSVANVYQSMATAVPLLDAGVPVVLSVAGSDWYVGRLCHPGRFSPTSDPFLPCREVADTCGCGCGCGCGQVPGLPPELRVGLPRAAL